MRLAQSVHFARFGPLSRQPAFGQLEQNDGLRLVDFQEDRRMHVDGNECDARIVCGAVTGIILLPEPCLPVGLVQFLIATVMSSIRP